MPASQHEKLPPLHSVASSAIRVVLVALQGRA
jgi:hypothetical protein